MHEEKSETFLLRAVAGLFFAGAVLCCPYLMLIYGGYSLALGIRLMRGKAPLLSADRREARQCWHDFTLGAGILAAVFLAVFVPRFLSELGPPYSMPCRMRSTLFPAAEGERGYYALWQANRFLPLLVILKGASGGSDPIRRHPAFFWIGMRASAQPAAICGWRNPTSTT